MSDALRVQNVGKAYKRYHQKYGRLWEWLRLGTYHELRWVLRDVSFDVGTGEAMGIVGGNGAGKSTLLKIIAGVVKPTTGSVFLGGRVAALLELGTGFHPDFTGRENVYTSGQLKGLSRYELDEKIQEIEEFADIGDYFDQPLRTYSSGMQVRLAFAVATAVRPEMFIVDEALSVGDATFQRKCFRRMEEFLASGTTLLLVSHSTDMVRKICRRAVFIHQGAVVCMGKADEVCNEYERFFFGGEGQGAAKTWQRMNVARGTFDASLAASCEVSYGNYRAEIEKVWLTDGAGNTVNVIPAGETFSIHYLVRFNDVLERPVFATMIKAKEGIPIYGTDTTRLGCKTGVFPPGERRHISFNLENNLAPGTYYVNCGVRDDNGEEVRFCHRRVDTLIFRVLPSDVTTVGSGVTELRARVAIEHQRDVET